MFENLQTRNGNDPHIPFLSVGRPPKAAQNTTPAGRILADNIRHLAALTWPDKPGETEWLIALGRRSGVGKETVRRMVKGIGHARLDNIEAVAHAFSVSLIDLLSAQRKDAKLDPHPDEAPARGSLHRR